MQNTLTIHTVPAFADNYIWLVGRPDRAVVAVVDPGDAAPVRAALTAGGLEPAAILLTHHHGDHTGGASELAAEYGIPVYGPAAESIVAVDHPLQGGEELDLAPLDLPLSVLATPGHTRGHLCYLGGGALFCGDTLFTGGCGRLFEGSPGQMYASLEQLRQLPGDTAVYCGHEYTLANLAFARLVEPESAALATRIRRAEAARAAGRPTVPSTIAEEQQTNPFLRCHLPEVADAARRFSAQHLEGPEAVFAVVRHWKDTLD